MKILIVVGARPNFVKAAPILSAIREHNRKAELGGSSGAAAGRIEQLLVHTGQHYDNAMSDSIFADLQLPKPDVHLGIGSGSHAVQTAEVMRSFEQVVLEHKPDVVLVVGDVNSTLGCALVTAKIAFDSQGTRPLIVHVEAGLRSFDSAMPEEVNRIVTDHISDMLFVSEESGIVNLQREGISPDKIHFVGNTMIDSLLACKEVAERSRILETLGLRTAGGTGKTLPYGLLTLHRPSNVDDRATFLSILEGLDELSRSGPIVFSAHPRTRKRIAEFGLERFFQVDAEVASDAKTGAAPGRIRLLDPVGYLDFLCLMNQAAIVVTDSGGIQEETTCLGVPCVTVRENTERPVTVTCGTNVIAGTKSGDVRQAIRDQRAREGSGQVPEKWDGKAGVRIIEAIVAELNARKAVLSEPRGQACLEAKN
jgi:UDP-N-acetylglucosamine 2-epimerase (non-hydrolysing)